MTLRKMWHLKVGLHLIRILVVVIVQNAGRKFRMITKIATAMTFALCLTGCNSTNTREEAYVQQQCNAHGWQSERCSWVQQNVYAERARRGQAYNSTLNNMQQGLYQNNLQQQHWNQHNRLLDSQERCTYVGNTRSCTRW